MLEQPEKVTTWLAKGLKLKQMLGLYLIKVGQILNDYI